MKNLKFYLAIFAIACLLSVPVQQANAEWWITDGEEDILLDRVDNALHAPLHEKDSGVYGCYIKDADNDEYKFEIIVKQVNISKDFESLVKWIPGSMDYVEKVEE